MDTAVEAWKYWRDERAVSARALYGPLSLTGTHWLDEPRGNGRSLPGRWTVDRLAGGVALTAARHDGLAVDDVPLEGTIRLCTGDTRETGDARRAPRISQGGRRLELIRRDDRYAVRVFDPASPARSAFEGIDAFPYDPAWAVPARFVPFSADRTERVPHSDGRRRPAVFAGTLQFRCGSAAHAVAVQRGDAGGLSISVSDSTRAGEQCAFRVVDIPAPDRAGATLADFNRAQLPPSAFAVHYLCPLPPEGNELPFPVRAGERRLLARR